MLFGPSPLLDIEGIPCSIYLGEDGKEPGIGFRWPANGPEATANVACHWADMPEVARILVGSSEMIGGVVQRTNAFRHPTAPKLVCQSIGEILKIGNRTLQVPEGTAPAGWVAGVYAVLPANFAILPYDQGDEDDGPTDPSGEPYTSTRFEVNSQVLVPPHGTYYQLGGMVNGKPIGGDGNFGIIQVNAEISMTRHKLPSSLDIDRLMMLVGTLNLNPKTFGNRTFPKGTLLYGGFGTNEQRDSLGHKTFDIENKFLGRYDKEWNEVLGQDAEWHLVNSKSDGSGVTPFKYSDFGEIP